VSNAIEQLRYTWVARGPSGQVGWQVVGASKGLSSGQLRAILRFCSIPKLPSNIAYRQALTSFGWWDSEAFRIVFHRIPRPLDGVPNNYVAHFLVATRSTIPAQQLLRRADSEFWWDGNEQQSTSTLRLTEPTHLPTLRLTDIPASEADPTDLEDVSHALGLLLSLPKNQGVALRLEPHRVVAVLDRLAAVLPELANGHTVSSIWNAQDPFCSIVGIGSDDPVPQGYLAFPDTPISPELALIASTSLDDSDVSRDLVQAARLPAIHGPGEKFNRREYCLILLSLIALEDGLSEPRSIMGALATPAGARLVLDHAMGKRLVIDALIQQDEMAIRPLTRSVELDESISSAIAAGLWDRVVQEKTVVAFSSALRVSRTLSDQLADSFLKRALSDDARTMQLVDSLSLDEAMQVLSASDETGLGTRSRAAILYHPQWQEHIAKASGLSRPWRACALADGLAGKTVSVSAAADLLAFDPELALETARRAPNDDTFLEALRGIRDPGRIGPTTTALVSGLGWSRSFQIALCATELVTTRYRAEFLRSMPVTRSIRTRDDAWDRLTSKSFQLEVQEACLDKRPSIVPSEDFLLLARGCQGPRVRTWLAALGRATQNAGRRQDPSRIGFADLRSAIRLLDRIDVYERPECGLLAVHTGLASDLEPAAIANAFAFLEVPLQLPVADVVKWILAISRAWVGPNGSRWNSTLACSMILLVAQNRIQIEKSVLVNRGLQATVEQVVRNLTDTDMTRCHSLVESCEKSVQKWWKRTVRSA